MDGDCTQCEPAPGRSIAGRLCSVAITVGIFLPLGLFFPMFFFIAGAIGIIGVVWAVTSTSETYRGICPYCKHETYGEGPVLKCENCKERISVREMRFYRV